MKTRRNRSIIALCGVMLLVAGAGQCAALAADSQPAAPRRFTATAEVSSPGSGTRTIQVDIVVDHVISQQEAKGLTEFLDVGGQRALQSAIQNRVSGRLTLGIVKYPLNIITAAPSGDGFRYAVVTVRSIKIHERDTGQPSLDYPFSVLVFEVDESGRGEGELYRTAALRVDASGQVEVEDFNGEAGRLTDIEPQR
jgi:hypothetical protein